eukprot:PITA_28038
MIVSDTLYRRGINTVLRRCLIHEEAEKVLNDCHSGTCGGHQSGYATVKNILRAGYFWPTMFKDCKTRIPLAPLQPVVVVGPFAKWGIDFMTCNPTSVGGHGYIIVAVDYFTKWAEAMPTLNNNGKMTALFIFNHLVYGSEAILPVQCEISSLKLAVDLLPGTSEEEAHFLELIQLDETHCDSALANEAHTKRVKAQFDKNVKRRVFSEGNLVLLYD